MKTAFTIGPLVLALMLMAGPAHAYLDPGTGSAIFQGILGALAALLVTLKLYWHRLLRALGFGRKNGSSPDSNKTNETPQESGDDRPAD